MLDGIAGSYVVPTTLSYDSSNSKKNQGEPLEGDVYIYDRIIPGVYGPVLVWAKSVEEFCKELGSTNVIIGA